MSIFRTPILGLLGCTVITAAAATLERLELPVAEYSVDFWSLNDHLGNHRAVIDVDKAPGGVRVHIPWRRHDRNPDQKGMRLFGPDGKELQNFRVEQFSAAEGVIAFEATAPGRYFLYYMPYTVTFNAFGDTGTYFPVRKSDWTPPDGVLLEAKLVQLQARNEFNRFDPMEIVPTVKEIARYKEINGNPAFLLFGVDRSFPVRMLDVVPVKLLQQEPNAAFTGDARPGEWYAWQVAVWATGGELSNLAVTWSDFSGNAGVIPASAVTCINTEGTDARGKAMKMAPSVAAGAVQPLWLIADVPLGAKSGDYTGMVTVKPVNASAISIPVTLKVSGETLPDHGVSNPYSMARLKWLNSTIGLDDEVIVPFKEMTQPDKNTLTMTTSQVMFADSGLPKQFAVQGHDLLAAPVRFDVVTPEGTVEFKAETMTTYTAPAAVERRTVAVGDTLSYLLSTRTETDGAIVCSLTLTSKKDVDLSDVRLTVPVQKDQARFQIGFGRPGGFRRDDFDWRWDMERATNYFWLGRPEGGVQLKLKGATDIWNATHLKEVGLPPGWYNGGAGGARVKETSDAVEIQAFSGARKLRAHEELIFEFRFLLTPGKALNLAQEHWPLRYGGAANQANIRHLHHGDRTNNYINYPFLDTAALTADIARDHHRRGRLEAKGFSYPLPMVTPESGSISLDAKVVGDPEQRVNRDFITITTSAGDVMNCYWNLEAPGLRFYVTRGNPGLNDFLGFINVPHRVWHTGEIHRIGLHWQNHKATMTVDGTQIPGEIPLPENWGGASEGMRIAIDGDFFAIRNFEVRSAPGGEVVFADDPAQVDSKIEIAGQSSREGGFLYNGGAEQSLPPIGTNIYYTVRELSTRVPELWALRSLGNEIFLNEGSFVYAENIQFFGGPGGGDPWLQEHLRENYSPGWRQPLPWENNIDAAIGTTGLSRWHNYYLEGMNWLMRNTGVDGIYWDGIGYDREIMKRLAKVMTRVNPNYRANCHVGNSYSFANARASFFSVNMEHMPYVKDVWTGEGFSFQDGPDFWLIEMSGLPFGCAGEMLHYATGGNRWQGMVYGMNNGRGLTGADAIYRFWDEWNIANSEMYGWWSDACPVRADHPEVYATVYRRNNEALIALAHWPKQLNKGQRKAVFVPVEPGRIQVDGEIGDKEWSNAARLTDFTAFGGGLFNGGAQTTAYVTSDGENLYLAVQADSTEALKLAPIRERDGAIWEDEAVEIFIQPDLEDQYHIQTIVNAYGSIFDGAITDTHVNMDKAFNVPWRVAAKQKGNNYTLEMAAPLAALGLEHWRGERPIGFNIARDHQSPVKEYSMWSPHDATFHEVYNFGRLAAGTTPTREVRVPQNDRVRFRLNFDWAALGIDPTKATLIQPAIRQYQSAAEHAPDDMLEIKASEGLLLIVK